MRESSDYFERKKSPATRSKHELLSQYQKKWQGIVLSSLGDRSGSLVYLDTCAGSGLFPSESSQFLNGAGSPIIGLSNLSEVKVDTRFKTDNKKFFALLYEKDPSLYAQLLANLQKSGIAQNLYHAENVDYMKRLDSILDCIKSSYTLAFFDPFSVGALAWRAVSAILGAGRTDGLIFFPTKQIQRYAGIAGAQPFAGQEKFIKQVDDFFGTEEWRQIASTCPDGNELAKRLLSFYMNRLEGLGKHCLATDLLYEDQNNIQFTFILATASIDAALQAKEVFAKMGAFQAYLRAMNLNQGLLFNQIEGIYESDPKDIAELLFRHFRGREVNGGDIYAWAMYEGGQGVFKGNLRRAITLLGKQNRIINPYKSKWSARSTIKFIA